MQSESSRAHQDLALRRSTVPGAVGSFAATTHRRTDTVPGAVERAAVGSNPGTTHRISGTGRPRSSPWGCLAAIALASLVPSCARSSGEQSRVDAPGEPSARLAPPPPGAPSHPRDPSETTEAPDESPRTGQDTANTAEALLASAARLEAVEVLDLDTRRLRVTFTAEQVEAMRDALTAATIQESFVNTPPPWSVAVRFRADGATVVGVPVGERALRVNPREPFSAAWASPSGEPLPGVRDIALGETLYDLLAEKLGPPSQEYRPARPLNLNGL